MEQETVQRIESLFQAEALLYADLAECFRKERVFLGAMDVESLWAVADEKNRICSEIGILRSKIASLLDLERDLEECDVRNFLDEIPGREQGAVRNVLLRIMNLKSEVEMMRKENQVYIDESLDFLDGMISLLSGERAGGVIYSGRRRLRRTESVVTMSREV